MGVKPVVTIISPTAGQSRGRPFTASGMVTPPDGVGTAGVIYLRNAATGELLATCIAPAGGGAWSAEITDAVMAMLSGTATPQQAAQARRAGLVLTRAHAQALRSATVTMEGTQEGTARRAAIVAPLGGGNARRAATAQAQGLASARLSETLQAQGKLSARRAGTVTPLDTVAPSVATFTVGTPSGLVVPVTAFTVSDNVAVTGYAITTTSTIQTPTPTLNALATPINPTQALTASGNTPAFSWDASAPTSWTAAQAGTYDLYPWVKDAAGNVSSVFGSPRNVTVT